MSSRKERRIIPPELISATAAIILVYVLIGRVSDEFHYYLSETILLRVEAKCPGLPFGSTSGGPDYINIALDLALVAAAGYLAYLTIRDILRRRRRQASLDEEKAN